jgi:hypothetical protein
MRTFSSELFATTALQLNVTNMLSVPKGNILQRIYGLRLHSTNRYTYVHGRKEIYGKYPTPNSQKPVRGKVRPKLTA